MARLRCDPELIADALFGKSDVAGKVRIVGAGFDTVRGVLVLEIEGEPVPNSDEVECAMSSWTEPPEIRVKFTAL